MLSIVYKMLIVDDERAIVNGLFRLFDEEFSQQLDIFRAYSGSEAYQFLQHNPVDIVMTDIRMPGMTGLELQKKTKELWPTCQIIFLTGFNDFDYVQEALRNDGTDYILKTEEDATIIQSVNKAIGRLNKQFEMNTFMTEANLKLMQALPILQKELLSNFLHGEGDVKESKLLKQMEELEFPLQPDRNVLLVLGRIDDWGNKINASDQMLMIYAMTNIVKEYMGTTTELYPFTNGQHEVIWFIQENLASATEVTASTKRSALLLSNVSESILDACKRYLGVTLSLAIANQTVEWEACRSQYNRLRQLLFVNYAMRKEIALFEGNYLEEEQLSPTPPIDLSVQRQQRKMSLLQTYLEAGQRELFFNIFAELVQSYEDDQLDTDVVHMHLYYGIVTIYLSYMHQWKPSEHKSSQLDIRKLTRMEQHESWLEAVQCLYDTADLFFSSKNEDIDEQDREVIRKIKRYVDENLEGDLSLTRIADLVGFNRSYLSRLYKQKTGQGLSEYIFDARLQKAKELLQQPAIKIYEISDALGFESSAYFTRFFKKATNLTPTEFRERDN